MADNVFCYDAGSATSIHSILSGVFSLSLRRLYRHLRVGVTLVGVLLQVCVVHAQKVKPDGNGGPGWVQTFTNVSSSGSPSTYLSPVTFTVGVLPSTCGSYIPVTVYDNGAYLGSITLNSHGSGSYSTSSLAVGSHPITASFPGNNVNGTTCLSSNSNLNPVNQVVNPAPPTISGLSPSSGAVGTPVVISGTDFGSSQGTSTVTFNGTSANISSWSNTSIMTVVPAGAATGYVVVTVSGAASNGVVFTVPGTTPVVTTVTPSSGYVGVAVAISGYGFGAAEGQSTVSFNGVLAGVLSWSDSSITAVVPGNATTGPVVVTLGDGEPSNNNVIFTANTSSCN